MELRPEVREVVAQLGKAAASWDGVMPPCSQGENVASGSEEMSGSEKYGEFGFFYSPLVSPIQQRHRWALSTPFRRDWHSKGRVVRGVQLLFELLLVSWVVGMWPGKFL